MILVSVSTDSLRDNVEALQSKARIATVAISIIGIFLSAIIGMLLVRPLKRMSQSIEEMAGGYGDNYLHENATMKRNGFPMHLISCGTAIKYWMHREKSSWQMYPMS